MQFKTSRLFRIGQKIHNDSSITSLYIIYSISFDILLSDVNGMTRPMPVDRRKDHNYKLIVDPFLHKGHPQKVYRFDGVVPGVRQVFQECSFFRHRPLIREYVFRGNEQLRSHDRLIRNDFDSICFLCHLHLGSLRTLQAVIKVRELPL